MGQLGLHLHAISSIGLQVEVRLQILGGFCWTVERDESGGPVTLSQVSPHLWIRRTYLNSLEKVAFSYDYVSQLQVVACLQKQIYPPFIPSLGGCYHLMVATVRGAFEKFSGIVEFDERDIIRSKVNIQIEAE